MIFGDRDVVKIIISRIKDKYRDVIIRYEFLSTDGSLIFHLQLGDKAVGYYIPRHELHLLQPPILQETLLKIIECDLINKKEEGMTHNLSTVDSLSAKLSDYIYKNYICKNTANCSTTHYISQDWSKYFESKLIDEKSLTPKKIIKSGPCTIVIWEDNTKTVVRLREGEKDDEFAAFSAAVVKKLYGSNSAVTKLLKKKTYVQEKEED